MTGSEGSPTRRLRLILRDNRVLTADARVARGQDLFNYLVSRTRYVSLTDVEWLGTREHVDFLALKTDQILWAASEDDRLPLTRGLAVKSAKRVELELEGGYLIAGGLLLIEDQRVSDYFRSAPRFVPLTDAVLQPRGRSLGDVVVHQEGIHIVREIREAAEAVPAEAQAGESETAVGTSSAGSEPGPGGSGREAAAAGGAGSASSHDAGPATRTEGGPDDAVAAPGPAEADAPAAEDGKAANAPGADGSDPRRRHFQSVLDVTAAYEPDPDEPEEAEPSES